MSVRLVLVPVISRQFECLGEEYTGCVGKSDAFNVFGWRGFALTLKCLYRTLGEVVGS